MLKIKKATTCTAIAFKYVKISAMAKVIEINLYRLKCGNYANILAFFMPKKIYL